ncbi:MAG: hypothetical protein LUP91_07170, partial [Methylococcaceae bacterium]|nr:hypothetical protein [Methylococcaceae bacterium]
FHGFSLGFVLLFSRKSFNRNFIDFPGELALACIGRVNRGSLGTLPYVSHLYDYDLAPNPGY